MVAYTRVYAALLCCGLFSCFAGCMSVFDLLFEFRPDLIGPTHFATDPLLQRLAVAVDRRDEAAFVSVVRDGADVDATGKRGYCLLYWAMIRNNVRGFELLLKHGAHLDADYRDPKFLPEMSYRRAVLLIMLSMENQDFLKAALRQGLGPNYVVNPKNGMTLLAWAGWEHSTATIETLLAAGADINCQDASGFTPFINAAISRDYATAWLLLRRGANPAIKDHRGNDFASWLKRYGSRGVRPDQRESFERVVDNLVKRGLLTQQDIIEADKPKPDPPGFEDTRPGITVIEHAPDSEIGRAIRKLDDAEREANRREGR
jgi:hypothetical protein